jgi:hypothetical protein
MGRCGPLLMVMLAIALQPSARGQTRETCFQTDQQSAVVTSVSFAEAVATQDRINRYHRDVVPKMRDCWDRLTGRGQISVRLQYDRYGDHWIPGPGALRSSTLPAGEDERALQCLQAAVSDTSFAAETSIAKPARMS